MVTLRIFIVNVFISTFRLIIFHISIQYKYKKISPMSILTGFSDILVHILIFSFSTPLFPRQTFSNIPVYILTLYLFCAILIINKKGSRLSCIIAQTEPKGATL